jgi:hypothetical protein
MALPPTVENLWITVGISLVSVGKAWKAPHSLKTQIKILVCEGGLSTKKWGLPTAYPHRNFSL